MKVAGFIDGFNLFHAIDGNPNFHKYKWLNLRKLVEACVPSSDKVDRIYYFTAYATWNQEKVKRHKTYVEALESVGVKTILGAFRWKEVKCFKCHQTFGTYVEKETDVNIAIRLFQSAIIEEYDKAIVVTGDSDMIPAIQAVKQTFPSKQVRIAIPINRRAEMLKEVAHSHMKLKERHLASCQFDEKITFQGRTLTRPSTWV